MIVWTKFFELAGLVILWPLVYSQVVSTKISPEIFDPFFRMYPLHIFFLTVFLKYLFRYRTMKTLCAISKMHGKSIIFLVDPIIFSCDCSEQKSFQRSTKKMEPILALISYIGLYYLLDWLQLSTSMWSRNNIQGHFNKTVEQYNKFKGCWKNNL